MLKVTSSPIERTEKLKKSWKPSDEAEFIKFLAQTETEDLKDYGFLKFDRMNAIIAENKTKPISDVKVFPILNSSDNLEVDLGRKDAPIKTLKVDCDLILFPKEWFYSIPIGFKVTTIWGVTKPFSQDLDDDSRFGCLAFGFLRPIEP